MYPRKSAESVRKTAGNEGSASQKLSWSDCTKTLTAIRYTLPQVLGLSDISERAIDLKVSVKNK